MTTRRFGGPAFPVFPSDKTYAAEGMTLRDWLAGMALGEVIQLESARDPRFIAEVCYGIADAMLAERIRGEEHV